MRPATSGRFVHADDENIYAEIIADSINERGRRLTTMEVGMHRMVLAEFNTHRVFSRNSASSRAIPVMKTLGRLDANTAMPLVWPAEKKGMQGGAELTGQAFADAEGLLSFIAGMTMTAIEEYIHAHPEDSERLHKSWLNRPLEWFNWHKVVVSATEWLNFFEQRCSPLAQPELRVVAELMRDALANSSPTELDYGDWHLPYVEELDLDQCDDVGVDARKVSAARCTRVSYWTMDGLRDPLEDYELFERLRQPGEGPPHASPLEHVATPARLGEPCPGNFTGWRQLRHEVLKF